MNSSSPWSPGLTPLKELNLYTAVPKWRTPASETFTAASVVHLSDKIWFSGCKIPIKYKSMLMNWTLWLWGAPSFFPSLCFHYLGVGTGTQLVQRHLLRSLVTWVQFLGAPWWKERTNSYKSSPGLFTCPPPGRKNINKWIRINT